MKHEPAFNLFVVYSQVMERAVASYTMLGLTFMHHRHGSGPAHYAAEWGGVVFKIYPMPMRHPVEVHGRFGFRVTGLDTVINKLVHQGMHLIQPPRSSPRGRRAVLKDMDGYSLEEVERADASDAEGYMQTE